MTRADLVKTAREAGDSGYDLLIVIFGEPDIDILDAEDGQVRVKVINHLGDEVMKVFRSDALLICQKTNETVSTKRGLLRVDGA